MGGFISFFSGNGWRDGRMERLRREDGRMDGDGRDGWMDEEIDRWMDGILVWVNMRKLHEGH